MEMKNTLMTSLGIELKHLEKGKIIMTMPVDEKTRQPYGILHGGASVALAETAASIGGYELVDKEKQIIVGLEINANHIKGKRDGYVQAIGQVIHNGKSTQVWEVRIVDEQDELICISRCTLAVLKREA